MICACGGKVCLFSGQGGSGEEGERRKVSMKNEERGTALVGGFYFLLGLEEGNGGRMN